MFLFNDSDCWTTSSCFENAHPRIIEASDQIAQILQHDLDVSFMLYFFGIQLLQGSLTLLFATFKFDTNAGFAVVNACEVVVRATEACFSTFSTDYQRHFRNAMLRARAYARGKRLDCCEPKWVLMFFLARYRWSASGTGLHILRYTEQNTVILDLPVFSRS